VKRRVRATGPRADVVEAVLERAQGLCEACGEMILGNVRGEDWSLQHRVARGMGGSRRPILNTPPNLLLVHGSGTTSCHGYIESHPVEATAAGWRLHSTADPLAMPVIVGKSRWVLLTLKGGPDGYRDCAPPAGVSA